MSLLKAEPAGTIRSVEELFALAYAMGQDAAGQYAALALEMRRQANAGLVQVFEQLAAEQRSHVEAVTRWSQSRLGKKPDPSLIHWKGPETFDTDTAAEIAASRLMTPYRALSMAVRNEERAFAFWSYVAARAERDETKQAAETMARQELERVAMLRKERRRAYHDERRGTQPPSRLNDASDRIDAGALERRLAELLADLAKRLDGPTAERARELSVETRSMSGDADGFGRFPVETGTRDVQAIAEALADAYLEGADAAADQERLDCLQGLARRSIVRLAWLRTIG
ncbi:MAG TPA: ferritin family protein [Xanthobacteraceae bacterium]|jgi:rubrerythrin